MKMNPLPPQAYTKDTLLTAYAWLQNQSDSIKELATTPDILVSLYLKAKLNGESALERPSIQNFKAELKNIANMMGEFETEKTQEVTTPSPTGLDNRSTAMIQEVKTEFNLSSDQEAMRMLIAVGYKKLKSFN